MTNLVCSVAVRKSIVAVLILKDGMVTSRTSEVIRDEKALQSSYSAIIYAFGVALRYVRDYIQKSSEDYSVCFETSNSTFVKWVDDQYSKEQYQESFMGMLRLLQELPIKYAFHYAQKPKALVYADKSYCKKEKLSGLDID